MIDVAARAGVSQTTVSLVLNNTRGSRIGATTRSRVREAARELGYALPRGPVPPAGHAGARRIGFIADEISTDPWCALQLDAVREKAWEAGMTVVAGVSHSDAGLEARLLDDLMREPLAGLVYATILTRRVRLPSARLLEAPTVLLNCLLPDHSLPSVTPAEFLGGHAATMALVRAGHRRIAHIAGQSWTDASRDRLKGYRRALAEHGIGFDPELVRPGNWEPPTGYQHTRDLMALADPPTAIFVANDMMAVGAYDALKELGLRIPQDVSVVGYDDREIAQFMRPPLTTVTLPHYEMGRQAVEVLAEGLRRGGAQPQIKVECTLVERQSVAPPP
ncbi:MAG: LacI family DNA-binding transcriptional regulator [Amaricoccus sp.]|nr:LacI family DNA-binding transcriptional regulator [Amaricoccus sp.]